MIRLTEDAARAEVSARGPRFAVTGTTRQGEMLVSLHPTASSAETAAERMRESARQVRLHLPIAEVDYAAAARRLSAARAEVAEATALAHAAALRMVEAGLSESETARQLGVDRMTVRGWLGKRR